MSILPMKECQKCGFRFPQIIAITRSCPKCGSKKVKNVSAIDLVPNKKKK